MDPVKLVQMEEALEDLQTLAVPFLELLRRLGWEVLDIHRDETDILEEEIRHQENIEIKGRFLFEANFFLV